MAAIDVSQLLSDPDFLDDVELIRRFANVNEFGESDIIETCENVVMVVQPAQPDSLARLPQGAIMADAIDVWYYGTLSTAAGAGDGLYTSGKYPDVIVWKGLRFQVRNTDPFGNWGDGYTRATCTLIPIAVDATNV